jgi:hypothetical protein
MAHYRLINTKAEQTKGTTFGSSAIFKLKIRRFPPLPRGRFGIIGSRKYNYILRLIYILSNAVFTKLLHRCLVTRVRTWLTFIKISVKMLSANNHERRASMEEDLRKKAIRRHLLDGEPPISVHTSINRSKEWFTRIKRPLAL